MERMKQVTPKILVIDDDPRLRDLLVRYLGEQGFQVQALPDARELDKRLQRDPPHLLVLDLMLPGEDGLGGCRRLPAEAVQPARAGRAHPRRAAAAHRTPRPGRARSRWQDRVRAVPARP